jgi:2-C-methyl-D-erythritol 4-phosphate cytidylyltransferase
MKTVAIITAAGQGKRMGQPKQFIKLGGQPMVERTIAVFQEAGIIDEIILVVNAEDIKRAKGLKFAKLKQVVAGGAERPVSVLNGLKALPKDADIVAIHDGARPFVTVEIIERSIAECKEAGAVVVGVPVKDTIKKIRNPKSEIRDNVEIIQTVDRDEIWLAQTPQVFKKDIILKAYQAGVEKHKVTDDAMLVEKLNLPVKMVMGSYQNIKVTTPDDLIVAEGFLRGGKE